MCGILGALFLEYDEVVHEAVEHGCRLLKHRGPDGSGIWKDTDAGVILGHVRLSILDLSEAGYQPMKSHCGRYQIVFNGEIYNHLELREKLNSSSYNKWIGHSDTETLLTCISEWGLDKTLESITGMFVFAIWDQETKMLYLARDRFGEKPLYYGWVKDVFVFGSELKIFKKFPFWENSISVNALSLFLRYNYIPAPHSIYNNIWKLPAGSYLKVSKIDLVNHSCNKPIKYWDACKVALQASENQYIFKKDSEAIDSLDSVLQKSIKAQMLSDVPVGAFLSGGIDSSMIVALMQKQSNLPVKTFSIGFSDNNYNEAVYANDVATHLGTDHTELMVSPSDALNVIPKLSHIYDEPFADSSQIPTYLLASLTKRDVTVALSGDAGDELFGGYTRYQHAQSIFDKMKNIPASVKSILTGIENYIPKNYTNQIIDSCSSLFQQQNQVSYSNKFNRFVKLLKSINEIDAYNELLAYWDPSDILKNGSDLKVESSSIPLSLNPIDQMMLFDTINYLPDDILVKVDRAAMAVSLETRVPFLDHKVYEFAWRLPFDYKNRGGNTKWLLRQLLYRYVPENLIDRPKMGFGVPIDSWLRGPLKDWAANLLDERKINEQGFFKSEVISKRWNEHISGKKNWHFQLWTVLMFQQWYEYQLEKSV
jgi:asparagine synthase (glutamine-hydrolysing)